MVPPTHPSQLAWPYLVDAKTLSVQRHLQLVGSRPTATVLLGRALVLLLFAFVLTSMATHGANLAVSMSILFGLPLGRDRFIPADLLNSVALLGVSAVVIVLIRHRFLQESARGSPNADAPHPFMPPADTQVARFLARFLPGLAHLRLRMSRSSERLTSRLARYPLPQRRTAGPS